MKMSCENDIIDPGSANEDSQGKGDKDMVANLRLGQTERLMKNLSRLSLAFGFSIMIGLGLVWAKAAKRVRAEIMMTSLGILIGAFILGAAVVVSESYGFGLRKLLERFFPHPSVWLRPKSDEMVLAGMPRAYLALSGIIMLVCSGVMIAGDIIISNSPAYEENVSNHVKGNNFYFAGCTVIFIPAACLSFALAMLTSKKHLKTIVACFFLASFVGLVASTYLNFRFEGPYRFKSMKFSTRLMLKDQQGINYIKGQEYPRVSMWLILKFVAAEIIMTFSFFNVLLAATLFVGFKANIKISSSRLLGILGIVMITAGLALEIVLNLLMTSDIMISGYSRSLQEIRPVVAISTLLAGIHAFNCFFSAGNLRKFTLFFLSVAVITSTVFSTVAVLKFRSEALEVETAALTPCPYEAPDAYFCVFYITNAYVKWYKKSVWIHSGHSQWRERCMTYVNEYYPPSLACIPREKLCDGRADLFMDQVDLRYYSSSSSKLKYK